MKSVSEAWVSTKLLRRESIWSAAQGLKGIKDDTNAGEYFTSRLYRLLIQHSTM